jgi:hypothetical protein
MKKIGSLLLLFVIVLTFGSSTTASVPPYVDAFGNYESFLDGVNYYVAEDEYYFTNTEIDLHDDYYISYVIEHNLRNQESNKVKSGKPRIIYQSKDDNLGYHFILNLKLKSGDETMTLAGYPTAESNFYVSGNHGSRIQFIFLNDQVLPENEINRILSLICQSYNKTLVLPS